MAIPSRPVRHLFSGFAALAAAAVFAGCSGSSQVPQVGTQQGSATTINASAVNPGDCEHRGPILIDVDPCSVSFTTSNPGPDTVTATAPTDKTRPLEESDNCGGASGVATLSRGSDNQWTVTAGPKTGSCTATFSYINRRHKVRGSANLSITNSI